MKIILIENGDVRIGYEFVELSESIIKKLAIDWVKCEIKAMNKACPYYYLFKHVGTGKPPHQLVKEIYKRYRYTVIGHINSYHFLFDENGGLLPVYYLENNKTVFSDAHYPCTIS